MPVPVELTERIRAFLGTRFPTDELADDDDIFALGFVSSLFAMELVAFLEDVAGVRIPSRELRLDNFRTVAGMVALVERQRQTVEGLTGR